MNETERDLTIVAVGDRLSKKTELLIKYTYNKEFYRYVMPDTFNNNVREIIVDYAPYSVSFIDCECDDDYELLRWGEYEKADVILLCYSLADRKTLENLVHKWCVEVRKIRPDVPVVLVATDTEVRGRSDASKKNYITTEEGENLKFAINACVLVECSVEKLVGIDDVFIEAVRSTYTGNTQDYDTSCHNK